MLEPQFAVTTFVLKDAMAAELAVQERFVWF
jgi:hypothetical protein